MSNLKLFDKVIGNPFTKEACFQWQLSWLPIVTPHISCMIKVAHRQALVAWMQSQNSCLTYSLYVWRQKKLIIIHEKMEQCKPSIHWLQLLCARWTTWRQLPYQSWADPILMTNTARSFAICPLPVLSQDSSWWQSPYQTLWCIKERGTPPPISNDPGLI